MDLRLDVNKKIEDQSQEKTGHFLMELQSLSASSNIIERNTVGRICQITVSYR